MLLKYIRINTLVHFVWLAMALGISIILMDIQLFINKVIQKIALD